MSHPSLPRQAFCLSEAEAKRGRAYAVSSQDTMSLHIYYRAPPEAGGYGMDVRVRHARVYEPCYVRAGIVLQKVCPCPL